MQNTACQWKGAVGSVCLRVAMFDGDANTRRVSAPCDCEETAITSLSHTLSEVIRPDFNDFMICGAALHILDRTRFLMASQHASPRVQDVFTTNIFGGADGDEGLALLSLRLIRLAVH